MECFHALVKAYKYKENEVKKRLITIIDSKNINVLDISTSSIMLAFEIAESYKTGGRDSLIAASLLENKIQETYSAKRLLSTLRTSLLIALRATFSSRPEYRATRAGLTLSCFFAAS